MAVVPAWPAAVVPYRLIMKIDEFCSEPMLRRKGNATFSHEKPFIPAKSTMHQSFETLGPPPYPRPPPPPPHTHTLPFSGMTGAFTFMQVKVCPWG